MADGSGSSVLTPSSPSTLDTTTQQSTNKALGQVLDILSSGSSDSTAILTQIANAIQSCIIGGTTGSTDTALLRAKGTGGFALQNSVVTVDDSGNVAGVNGLQLPLTPYAVVCGGTANPGDLQPISSVGTAKQILASNGVGALPSFQSYVDWVSGIVTFPSNGALPPLILNAPVGLTITSTSTISAAGTGTATFSINGVNLGGSANSISTSLNTQSHVSANVVAAGNTLVVTLGSLSSCTGLAFTVVFTRGIS